MNKKDYIVVTAVSMFRTRYVMHKDDLTGWPAFQRNLSGPDITPDNITTVKAAKDAVTNEECDEFSQEYIGQYIVDQMELNEDNMLELFDKDNDYLSEWTTDEKTKWIRQQFKDLKRWKRVKNLGIAVGGIIRE